ncbi:uncharacterized protein J3D65DRAFT_51685 [Phyllosticta citribraziliensis]|uniref:Uncharacterized protein n=1 Tax=Phyllosticta citribraziliensis TaxID=989973 RepID=A0ABR1LGE5_9PEZI
MSNTEVIDTMTFFSLYSCMARFWITVFAVVKSANESISGKTLTLVRSEPDSLAGVTVPVMSSQLLRVIIVKGSGTVAKSEAGRNVAGSDSCEENLAGQSLVELPHLVDDEVLDGVLGEMGGADGFHELHDVRVAAAVVGVCFEHGFGVVGEAESRKRTLLPFISWLSGQHGAGAGHKLTHPAESLLIFHVCVSGGMMEARGAATGGIRVRCRVGARRLSTEVEMPWWRARKFWMGGLRFKVGCRNWSSPHSGRDSLRRSRRRAS